MQGAWRHDLAPLGMRTAFFGAIVTADLTETFTAFQNTPYFHIEILLCDVNLSVARANMDLMISSASFELVTWSIASRVFRGLLFVTE
jgi:hypothetical protein